MTDIQGGSQKLLLTTSGPAIYI